MRIPRVFIQQPLCTGTTIQIEGQAAHYLSSVLRMESGRPLRLFNGLGGEFGATVQQGSKKAVSVEVQQFFDVENESPVATHLAVGISRGERMDWIVQKATELGASRITPVFSERTEVKLKGDRLHKKLEHWRQIMISACEQCQRNRLPELQTPLTLQELLAQADAELKLVLHHRSSPRALASPRAPSAVDLLIGPEGGLTANEIDEAERAGFCPLTLGPRVMRTETAPIAALAVIQYQWGDFAC